MASAWSEQEAGRCEPVPGTAQWCLYEGQLCFTLRQHWFAGHDDDGERSMYVQFLDGKRRWVMDTELTLSILEQ